MYLDEYLGKLAGKTVKSTLVCTSGESFNIERILIEFTDGTKFTCEPVVDETDEKDRFLDCSVI